MFRPVGGVEITFVVRWDKTTGTPEEDLATRVGNTPDGGAVVVGHVGTDVDSARSRGSCKWRYPCSGVPYDNDGVR